uniref:Uncharacterized protein n=1 Tax=Rhizophora mucronata TaxID=61149 RepID=A0A2P2LGI5_RHIMU
MIFYWKLRSSGTMETPEFSPSTGQACKDKTQSATAFLST